MRPALHAFALFLDLAAAVGHDLAAAVGQGRCLRYVAMHGMYVCSR